MNDTTKPDAPRVSKNFLNDHDFSALFSFDEQVHDAGEYSTSKATMKRLAELGVIQSHGFGRYSITAFGHWVIEAKFSQNPPLPLRTVEEHNARELAGRNLYNKGIQSTAWVELPLTEREKWRVTAERELPTDATKGEV